MEKICENCRYFQKFYVRYRLRFSPAGNGQCARTKKVQILQFPFDGTCSYWKEKENDAELRKGLATTAFTVVYERIEELISLLKDQ